MIRKTDYTLLDGKTLARKLQEEIRENASKVKAARGHPPQLVAVLVGNDGASETYVNHKVKACERTGIRSQVLRLPQDVSLSALLEQVDRLNKDEAVDGMIVQLPLPGHIDVDTVVEAILPEKDVDGFHPVNLGRMTQNLPAYISATPAGILQLLDHYQVPTEGKHCVVLGRSAIVGRPISILLSRSDNPGNCTVTLCHSRTKELEAHTRRADIIIAALGKPAFLTGDMVKKGVVVVDVGITRIEDVSKKRGYRLQGDVDFESVGPKSSFITPVPGGVGPMTVTGLLWNTLKAARQEVYQ